MMKRILISLYFRLRMENVSWAKKLYSFYTFHLGQRTTSIQLEFGKSLSFFRSDYKKSNGILLTQMVESYGNTIKLAAVSKVISEEKNLAIYTYDVHVHRSIGWANEHQKTFGRFFKTSNEIIHDNFSNGIIFKNDDKFHDQELIRKELTRIKLELRNREDLLKVTVKDMLIGDLIYDTYLRFFHKPTVEKIDDNVFLIVEVALNIFYNFSLFIERNNVRCVVNNFASYIQHGIPARIAGKAGIEVFTLGSRSYLFQKFEMDFPYCTPNFTRFSPSKKLPEGALSLAEKILTSRLQGGIDSATYYMKESSFARKPFLDQLTDKFKKRKRNIVIYAHEFYDSPHINRNLEFADLYQYLREVLQNLAEAKEISVFIKTHPGGMDGTKEEAIKLVKSFNENHFYVLDENVSNLQIVDLKPDLIATARGSVGVEMSYFGLPVVALYDNPYVNFDFVHTCYDKESYLKLLRGEGSVEIVYDKDAIYSYFYQAFLEHKIVDEPNVISFLSQFDGNTYSDQYLEHLLNYKLGEKYSELISHYESALTKIRAEDRIPSAKNNNF
jgi:hypothetical protein